MSKKTVETSHHKRDDVKGDVAGSGFLKELLNTSVRIKSGLEKRLKPVPKSSLSRFDYPGPVGDPRSTTNDHKLEDDITRLEGQIKLVFAQSNIDGSLAEPIALSDLAVEFGLSVSDLELNNGDKITSCGVHHVYFREITPANEQRSYFFLMVLSSHLDQPNDEISQKREVCGHLLDFFGHAVFDTRAYSEQNKKTRVLHRARGLFLNPVNVDIIASILGSDLHRDEKLKRVRNSLNRLLRPAFEEYAMPRDAQVTLLEDMSGRFLALSEGDVRTSWVERTKKEGAITVDLSPFKRLANIPTFAPVTWEDGRRENESFPDFVERIYGRNGLDVLRPGGEGLRAGELYKLDRSIESIGRSYKRLNDMPESCPLPTDAEVKEMQTRYLAALGIDGIETITDSIAKLNRSIKDQQRREK